ncbi:winged helix-turn-helix transcriptional regulator [Nocardia miyunensis]|uniref:winged helix-turn-helix transcriptional regulator n=1 Tax=Nocardia miyunensis TaxID=282684 RepID=UPI00083426EA|nr:winged helix-turn-helix transcriptional regulator [Nocardia miyunensis]
MARRSYNQYCGLSRSLDLVGERWTLLIVRELMSGPKRYSDLADALDGIGTSLLAARVKQLEQDGLIARRQLPRPAASQVYDLTPAGRELAAALVPLALWGLRHEFDEPRRPGENYRAEWTLVFLATLIDPSATTGLRATIQFRLDDSPAVLSIDDGEVHVTPGEADHPDIVVNTGLRTLAALTAAGSPPSLTEVSERIRIEGDPALAQLLLELLSRNRFGGLLG